MEPVSLVNAIAIPFDPVAAHLGPLAVTWHGIFSAAGILAGMVVAARLAPAAGITADAVWGAAWWLVLGGLAGARLLFAAEHPALFTAAPLRIFLLNEGGSSVFGAVLGGLAAGALWAHRAGVSPSRLFDAAAPAFLVGQAIGRIGDIVNGEHLGAPAPSLPWAVVYTHPNTLGELGAPVHPAVAYELLWDLAAAAATLWVLRRRGTHAAPGWGLDSPPPCPSTLVRVGTHRPPRPGAALWAALFLYGLGRLWVGFFRLDQHIALGLGLAQVIGLASLPIALAGLAAALRARPARRLTRRLARPAPKS